MASGEATGPFMRILSSGSVKEKKVSVKRSYTAAREPVEDTKMSTSGNAALQGKDDDDDDDATVPIVGFGLTFIFPLIGYVVYCMCSKARADSPRYIWAYRAMRLGAALTVVYSFIIASVLHAYRQNAQPGDILGYSYR